jgi:2'-5' RNA ligase
MIRAFAALPLPEDLRARLARLALALDLPDPLPEANYHLTLAFLGEVPEPVLEDAHYAFEALRALAFPLTLSGVGVFGGAELRAVYAGVRPEPALEKLAAKVSQAARQAGIRLDARRFVPHVTLARLKPGSFDPSHLERAIAAHTAFAAPPVTADGFALFRSHRGKSGAFYEELARYPLFGAA